MLTYPELERLAVRYLHKFIGGQYVNRDNIDTMVSGLLDSMTKYDASKGTKLTTYLHKKGFWVAKMIAKHVKAKYKKPQIYSLDAATEENYNWYDVIPEKEKTDHISSDVVDFLLQSKFLNERDRDVIHMIFVENKTLKECGEKYGVSLQAIDQRLKNVLYLMNASYKSKEHLKEIAGGK